jgi:hypothetical protein
MPASAHTASRLCHAAVATALRHLTTPPGLSRWALGLWNCREVEPGLFTGESLFDGAVAWVRIVRLAGADAVDYHVGATPDRLLPRIHARVIDGPLLGHPAGTCVVSLLAWQPADMPEERWRRLVVSHETEIELIQAQLAGADR